MATGDCDHGQADELTRAHPAGRKRGWLRGQERGQAGDWVHGRDCDRDGGCVRGNGLCCGSVRVPRRGSVHGFAHGSTRGLVHGLAHGLAHGLGLVHGLVHGSVHGLAHGSVHGWLYACCGYGCDRHRQRRQRWGSPGRESTASSGPGGRRRTLGGQQARVAVDIGG